MINQSILSGHSKGNIPTLFSKNSHEHPYIRVTSTPLKKHGFTLIELLVVIAIIAILAAILFPVFGRARENARRTSCMSNSKQWGLGFMQYTQDYDEAFPLMGNEGNTGLPAPSFWYNAVYAYTKSRAIQTCPSDSSTVNDKDLYAADMSLNTERFSYLANDNLCEVDSAFNYHNISLAAMPSSSETILLAEGLRGFGQPYIGQDVGAFVAGEMNPGTSSWMGYPFNATWAFSRADQQTLPRHFDGTVFTFADGHAKWKKVANKVAVSASAPAGIVSLLEAQLPWERHCNPRQNNLNSAAPRVW